MVRLVLGSLQVKAFVCLALVCPYPFSQRQALGAWLTTLSQIVLSANIPWDFERSELETKMIIPCRNPTRRKPSTGNLEEAVQLHADACVCHLERANLEQPETVTGKVVFLELSHTLPSCKAIVRRCSHSSCTYLDASCTYGQSSALPHKYSLPAERNSATS